MILVPEKPSDASPDEPHAAELVAEIADELAHVPLRLTATRGVLGLELYEQIRLGPLEVLQLGLTLPNLSFPLDLSGGVPKFRHRRGELEELSLRLDLSQLGTWLEPFAQKIFGPLVRTPAVWLRGEQLGFGFVAHSAALAVDVVWAPDGGAARFVLKNARGSGLEGPALCSALRLLDVIAAEVGVREGRSWRIDDVGLKIGRAVLPRAGARAPAAAKVKFGEPHSEGEFIAILLDADFPLHTLSEEANRSLALAALTQTADDQLLLGNSDAARRLYLEALERAPRHPEIVRAIAEIDASVEGRAEAAVGLLLETQLLTQVGAALAELFVRIGDREGARQAISEAATREEFAPLAAHFWLRLAELEQALPERISALDQAVVRAPALALVRTKRFAIRLLLRDVDGALADAKHLEAAANGVEEKFATCIAAASALFEAGFIKDAGKIFERALRYVPDDVNATIGLAKSLLSAKRTERALALFERAVRLSEKTGRADPEALVELARLVAEHFQDLPQAIAHVRQVPAQAARAIEARFLEANYRNKLGDRVGASLAYARMREAVELAAKVPPSTRAFLIEAALFERDTTRDALAAERYLALSLRHFPHDAELQTLYRDTCNQAAEQVKAAQR